VRKVCFVALMGLCVVSLFLGASFAQEKPVVLKFGNSYPVDHPSNVGARKMAEIVAAKTNGKLKIELYPAGQLGSDKDNIEGTIMGTQDLLLIGAGGISQYSPRLGIGECPYIWRDIDHMNKVMEGPVGDMLGEDLLKGRGLRILTVFYYGKRQLTSNKPIRTLADLKGFKLRTPQNAPIMEMAKSWGASPTPMDIKELYFALRQNVVDGQENPLPTIDGFKFFEAQKYIMLTGHIITPLPMIINEREYKRLSPEFRTIVRNAALEARDLNNKLMQEQESSLLDKFKAAGMTVIAVDAEPFRQAAQSVHITMEKVWGKGLYENIVAVK